MVLPREGSDSLSRASFDGSDDSDFMKFFFIFWNVNTRGFSDVDKAIVSIVPPTWVSSLLLLRCISRDGALTEEPKVYRTVNISLIDRFENHQEP